MCCDPGIRYLIRAEPVQAGLSPAKCSSASGHQERPEQLWIRVPTTRRRRSLGPERSPPSELRLYGNRLPFAAASLTNNNRSHPRWGRFNVGGRFPPTGRNRVSCRLVFNLMQQRRFAFVCRWFWMPLFYFHVYAARREEADEARERDGSEGERGGGGITGVEKRFPQRVKVVNITLRRQFWSLWKTRQQLIKQQRNNPAPALPSITATHPSP